MQNLILHPAQGQLNLARYRRDDVLSDSGLALARRGQHTIL